MPVFPDHLVESNLPDLRSALAQLAYDVARGLDHRHAARECDAAAAGEKVVAERARVADDRSHFVDLNAELFGGHHRERCARAADVGRTGHQGDRAVIAEIEDGAGFSADV